MKSSKSICLAIVLALACRLCAAADVVPAASAASLPASASGNTTSAVPAADAQPSRAELALFALGLVGSVYRVGGDNPQHGMDCSGFVRYVYRKVAGLSLPHNAAAISHISEVISKTDLKPGDLVFFKTMKKAFSHVGIYLGNNQFVHASSSTTGSVMVSNLDDSYWRTRFDGARRLLAGQHDDNGSSSPTDGATGMPVSFSANSDPLTALTR